MFIWIFLGNFWVILVRFFIVWFFRVRVLSVGWDWGVFKVKRGVLVYNEEKFVFFVLWWRKLFCLFEFFFGVDFFESFFCVY